MDHEFYLYLLLRFSRKHTKFWYNAILENTLLQKRGIKQNCSLNSIFWYKKISSITLKIGTLQFFVLRHSSWTFWQKLDHFLCFYSYALEFEETSPNSQLVYFHLIQLLRWEWEKLYWLKPKMLLSKNVIAHS